MPSWLVLPSWLDLLDIALVAAFGWLAIRYLRRTRARVALGGLALLALVYVIARTLELRLSEALFRGFFAVLVLVLVVVFQDDLRRVFEQLGGWWRGRAEALPQGSSIDLLARIVARLASNRVGALIVLPGQEPLDRHIEGGIELDGRLSEPLLLSLFDASSPGHDGAVVLRGSSVERFAAHLPLSANRSAIGPGGTRHAAGLGLAERCDATCIVVSEERGTIAVARDGAIRVLPRPEDLVLELQRLFEPEIEARPWWRGRAGLDAVLATVGALVLWIVLVPGSDLGELSVDAGVEVVNMPNDFELEATEPPTVAVALGGLRRDLLLADPTKVLVRVDAYLVRLGRRTFTISTQDVEAPAALSVVSVHPEKVRLRVKAVGGPVEDDP